MTKKRYVIYWEQSERRGFVSYDNPQRYGYPEIKKHEEYEPVELKDASIYGDLKSAERTRDWYHSRGGFGYFTIMEIR